MRKIIKDNRGLSLVELLIALVIGSILVAGIGSIMIVSSRSFSSTSAEAAMQSSAQIVMDHIQDVVVDANQKVIYSYTTAAAPGPGDWTDVVKDSDITDPESSITYKKLSVYTFNLNQVSSPDVFNEQENKHYDIVWEHDTSDDEKSVINFEQQDLNYNPTTKEIEDAGGFVSEKLADNVKSFRCDLSDMEKKRIIYVEMDFSKANGRYVYHAANNISLRNKVALSTDSIAVSPSVNLITLALTAEPGMDLPLTYKSITTSGNASNHVTYELNGGDGGRTAAGTDITGPSTLHVDEKERAAVIVVDAVDSMGGRHPFDVYINRVKWTSNNAALLGESDDVEGIELVDSPVDDEVDAGTTVPITVKLNSNPGAPGIDRTKPEKVTGEIKKVVTKTGADVTASSNVKLEPAGNLGWMLDVPHSVQKDTKITIRFTADHSLADGGIATRTVPYPGSDGVFKEIELTVTEAGVSVSKSPFLRGMKGRIIYVEYLEQFFNEAGKSEWEEYKRIPSGQIDNHYLVWKQYAHRAAVDGSKNHNYPNDSADWIIDIAGATEEKYETANEYQSHGWNVINGGKEGNFHGSEFRTMSPDVDTGIVFAVVVQYKQNNAVRWFSTTPAQTMMYGFREMIAREADYAKYEKQYDVGSFYKLDKTINNETLRDRLFVNKRWFVWQKEACFDNLSYGGNDGGLSISTYMSDTAFEGGQSLGSRNNVEDKYGEEAYTGNHSVYMARLLPMTEIKNRINNNFFNNFSGEEKEYYIWPKFNYNGTTFDRTSGYIDFKVKQGNITLKNNDSSSNEMEGFVPYPAYTTDSGFAIEQHPEFYGAGYGLDDVFTSVGQRDIRHYNNRNYTGNIVTNNYSCSMKYTDGKYYLRITGLADYRFDPSTERWEFVRTNKAEANLISGLNGLNKKDVFLPGVGDEEFFTGFKDIEDQQNTEKRWANRMAVYSTVNGLVQYDSYKIAYYRQDGKYCVDIYTLGNNGNVYRKYSYNENSEQWEDKGAIFNQNMSYYRLTDGGQNYYYVPTRDDKLEWFNFGNTNGEWRQSSAIKRYKYVNGSWTEYSFNKSPTIWYVYNQATGDLRINFAYTRNDGIQFKYDFNRDTWVRQ